MFLDFVKLQKYSLIIVLLSIFLYSCANIQPPSGGPKDTAPPFVKEFYPKDKTLNFDDDYVEIEFSEWVNRNLVVQNIMISPVSVVSYKWSGKKLRINFENKKQENTTYLISLGTEWSDQSGNKPDSAFSFTFSTGNTIDSGRIEGVVYGSNVAGTYVYAYRIDNKNPDTLNPEITPAEYRTQLGSNGSFSLLALPDGTYRIMAVKTPFKDNLFHPKTDEFGTYWQNVVVENGSSRFVTIKMGKYPDYSPIKLNSVLKIDSNKLLLEFNKLVKIAKEDIDLIDIRDSINSNKIHIKLAFLDSIFTKRLFVRTIDNLPEMTTIRLSIKSDFLTDTSGIKNELIDGYFKIITRSYSIPFEFNKFALRDSAMDIENVREFLFSLNKSFTIIDSSLVEIANSASNYKIGYNIKIDGNVLIIELRESLMANEWYKLSINTGKILSIEGEKLADTTLVFHFKTIDWRQFPSVSGKLLDSVGCNDIVITLNPNQTAKAYQTSIKKSGDWAIAEVRPGKYLIEIFCDENKNGKYDYGRAYPFKFAEKFLYTKQEIEVKPRWDVQNVLLFFKLP